MKLRKVSLTAVVDNIFRLLWCTDLDLPPRPPLGGDLRAGRGWNLGISTGAAVTWAGERLAHCETVLGLCYLLSVYLASIHVPQSRLRILGILVLNIGKPWE